MAAKPLVSVIMATYNRAEFIEEAIDSVLAQDYDNYELIIIDDGSTDHSGELIAERYSRYPQISYHYQANAGQMAATNEGIKRAKGDFIALIDSDNAWVADKLSTQIALFAQHPEVDIVYGDIIIMDEHSQEVHRNNMRRYSGNISAQLLKDNCVSVNTAMTRKRCFDELGGMNTAVEVAGDYEMWLRFSSRYQFHYEPKFFAYYRVMQNQISSDKTRRFRNTEKMVLTFIQQYPDATSAAEKRAGLAHFYLRKGRYHAGVDQYKEAWRCAGRAFVHHPLYPAVYRFMLKLALRR